MATVKEHYSDVLSDVYSWMLGGFDAAVQRNAQMLEHHKLVPESSGIAIDLGAGCGFQSIPLAQLGFSVTSFDLDSKLLQELKSHIGELSITTVQDDMLNFDSVVSEDVELAVCMTDTLLHLDSKEKVTLLFKKVCKALTTAGKFVLSFRDLTQELTELDRFIPVKSDSNTVFTCFLEYEAETVKVNDVVYKNSADGWVLNKSFYRKLRLSESWVKGQLAKAGFTSIDASSENGMITLIAKK